MRHYILKNIVECSPAQQREVLAIRNSDAVRRAMYTEHMISWDEHQAYIARLAGDDSQVLFAVLDAQDEAVGVASVSKIDLLHRKCDWAFFLGSSARGGVGSAIEVFMLDYVMDTLNMEKLNCEVIATNPAVVAMHKGFGFVEEGLRRANIEKDGARIDVHFLGITRQEWAAARPDVLARKGDRLKDIQIRLDRAEGAAD